MKYFRHETERKSLTIYPIVCMHVGVAQSDTGFIVEHIKRIKEDPNGVAVYLGDAGDCSIIHSKGDVYTQDLSPGDQLTVSQDLLEPIADKLLFGISGNHGRRVTKSTGVDWDQMLCTMLGVPYLGLSVFMKLKMTDITYDCFFHHGAASSITPGGKLSAAMKFNPQAQTDAVFTAHSHACMEAPVETIAYLPTREESIAWRTKHNYICGCGYDSRTGYAVEKGYPPILPAYLGVTFQGNTNKKQTAVARNQSCCIWRAKP